MEFHAELHAPKMAVIDPKMRPWYIFAMLFMIVEEFKGGDPRPIRERFLGQGRMLPEGVIYHASWVDPDKARCFQVMEAPDIAAVQQWADRWADLVGFEIVPVISSQDYWAGLPG
jgi:hypothetical protein